MTFGCTQVVVFWLPPWFIQPFQLKRLFANPFLPKEQKANAKVLEPAFEALLRAVDLSEELIMILRIRNVLDREIFSSIETNEEKFRDTMVSACGIDPSKLQNW